MYQEKEMKNKKGITLIALIITIIVLLILAGVSISLVVGENGVINRATEASEKTKIAKEKEGIELSIASAKLTDNGYIDLTRKNLQREIDTYFGKNVATVQSNTEKSFIITFDGKNGSMRSYNVDENGKVENGINWNEVFANAIAPEEQTNKEVVGVGTDGNVVNMDFWKYTLMEDGTYGLNDKTSLEVGEERSSGYSNENLVDGKIKGSIPQYIKDKDGTFKPVTDLSYLFFKLPITEPPIIPPTVKNMRATFNTTNITTVPIIPYGVENLYGTFASCKNLVNASIEIPSSVTNMYGCFLNCSLLIEPPLLNNGIENLENTFENCEELQKTPIIPESVTNIRGTFSGCKNLSGILIINGNISGEIYGEGQTKYAWCLKNAVTVEGKTLKISGNWKLLKDKGIIKTTFGIDDNNSERIILYE